MKAGSARTTDHGQRTTDKFSIHHSSFVIHHSSPFVVSALAFVAVFGWAVVSGKYLIGGDVFFYTYPLRSVAWDAVRAGHLPLWTPHVLSGYPLLSMSQLGVGYPLTWGHLFLPHHLAEQLYIYAPFLLAPAFTYFFARATGRSRLASALAGLTFAYGGLMTNGFGMNGLTTNAVAWLPLLLAAAERARRSRRFAAPLLLGALAYALSVLNGYGLGFLYVALVALAYALFLSLFVGPAQHAPTGERDEPGDVAAATATRDEGPPADARRRLSRRVSWDRFRPFAVAAASVALGAGVGAFQILETMRAARRSIRSALTYDFFIEGSFTPAAAVRSFLAPPYHFIEVTANVSALAFLLALCAVAAWLAGRAARTGRRHDGRLPGGAHDARVIDRAHDERGFKHAHGEHHSDRAHDARYFARARDPRVAFWAVVAVAAFLLMLGDATPLNRLVFHTPVLNLFRRPSRHAFEWTFALSILAAYGWDAVDAFARERLRRLREGPSARKPTFAVAAAAALLVACVWLAARWHAAAHSLPYVGESAPAAEALYVRWKLAFTLAVVFALAASWLVARRGPRAALLASVMIVGALAEARILVTLWWPGTAKTAERLTAPARSTRWLQNFTATENRVYVRANSAGEEHRADPRFDALDLTAPHGLHNAAGYEQFVGTRYSRALGDVGFDAATARGDPAANLSLFAARSRVLDLLNVTHVVAFPDLRAAEYEPPPTREQLATAFMGAPALDPARWQRAAEFEGVVVLRNLRALPRAWLVARAEAVDGEEALKAIRGEAGAREFDPLTTALLEVRPDELPALPAARADELPALPAGAGGASNEGASNESAAAASRPDAITSNGAARVTAYEANRIVVETESATPAVLVLSEVFYPGWEASVDGEARRIMLANYLLRAVAVPAGRHTVEMRYAAPAARNGAIISALTLAALIALAFVARRERVRASNQ